MTITDRAAIVLQQIDAALALAEKATPGPWKVGGHNINGTAVISAIPTLPGDYPRTLVTCEVDDGPNATFIAASRTLLPASLRCLKTAIEGLLSEGTRYYGAGVNTPHKTLTTLCDQWEAGR